VSTVSAAARIKEERMFVFKLALAAAVAALGIAPAASAATFDGVGTHQLRSTNVGFNSPGLGDGGGCTTSDFTVVVPSGGATASVTAMSFSGCTGTGLFNGLTMHMTATGLPWPITTLGTAGRFRIDGIHITDNVTGFGHITLHGNLDGALNCSTHVTTFNNDGALTEVSALGGAPMTVSGSFTDSLNTLCIT
jgi:hypothetical protein